jgi:hypothetical protein
MYSGNLAMIKVCGETSHPIPVNQGIRQGDSLSPLLFNIIMNQLIKSVSSNKGFKMGDSKIKIICYADVAVLLSYNEDDLQRMLFNSDKTAKNFNMKIPNEETKSNDNC